MSDVTIQRLREQKLSWRASQMFRTGPPLRQAGVKVSSLEEQLWRRQCAMRPLNSPASGAGASRWPARVYKAITACPGSWIIRVRVDTMQVGCVLCVSVLQLHAAGFLLCSPGSVNSCAKELSSYFQKPS